MPFPNARAVPPGLADRLAPTVVRGLTARVRLRRPDQVAVRDTTTGRTVFAAAEPYYTGPARVQSQGGGPPSVTGADRAVATGGYLVGVPHTVTGVRPFDLVDVVDGGNDPGLAGLVLVVDDISGANVLLLRNLTCSRHTGVTAGT